MSCPSLDSSPSSLLLVEDVHQGVTSAQAQRTIQRYQHFVAAQRAPVAHMNYSPFTRQPHNNSATTATEGANAHHTTLLADDDLVPASSSSSSASSRAHSPAPTTRARSDATVSSNKLIDYNGDLNCEGRDPYHALNPSIAHVKAGGEAWTVDFDNWNHKKEEPLLTATVGGGGIAGGLSEATGSAPSSKRGSLSSSYGGSASRKSSLNMGDPKLVQAHWGRRLSGNHSGYETSQQIWNMQGETTGRGELTRYGRVSDSVPPQKTSSSEHAHAHAHARHTDHAALLHKESQLEASDRMMHDNGVPKRLSLIKQPFLRAHQTENRLGVTKDSKPIHHATGMMSAMAPGIGGLKNKRSSMPPLQNKRGLINSGLSRRGSVSFHPTTSTSTRTSSSGASSKAGLGSSRGRSQSLPTDSLFLAYSQCALPAILTSSLASMPIPSQPAIPVEVARRYSALNSPPPPSTGAGANQQQQAPMTHSSSFDALAQSSVNTNNNQDAAEPEVEDEYGMVHINPESVEGIDTTSVLDTTQLQDLIDTPTDRTESENLAARCPQPVRRGSVSGLRGLAAAAAGSSSIGHGNRTVAAIVQDAASRLSSPTSSPVDCTVDGAAIASLPSFPEIAAWESTSTMSLPSSSNNSGARSSRARSMTQPKLAPSPASSSSTSAAAAAASSMAAASSSRPAMNLRISPSASVSEESSSLIETSSDSPPQSQAPSQSTSDFTPMTSPTNLGAPVFRHTLMNRRMSEVVARDIGKKLAILKKHMHEDEAVEALRA